MALVRVAYLFGAQSARVGASSLVADGAHYSVATASPREVAQILDAIFRQHFGVRPFADQGGDYAVGAEWQHAQKHPFRVYDS